MAIRIFVLIIFIAISGIDGQDFSAFKKLINEGKVEEVQIALPNLIAQYPNHPFIAYLQAAVNTNGEEAITQLQALVKDYPQTMAAELALMKIGEYLFAQGLYSKANEQLKIIPLYYPESQDIERAVSLMKKSYLATGEVDSCEFYLNLFKKKYPKLNFTDYDYYAALINPAKDQLDNVTEAAVQIETQVKEPEIELEPAKIGEKPWIVQVGAFRDKKNAEIVMNRLQAAADYTIELIENSGDLSLYLVQIVRFATIEEAIITGEEINDKFGLEFHILERN